jgi:glycine C-acetyltransferase
MGLDNLEKVLSQTLKELKNEGRLKGKEFIITRVKRPEGNKGPRYLLKGKGEQEFIRTNSNSYLGVRLRNEIIGEEEKITQKYGVGPGAVRLISGTFKTHREFEKKLATFHGRDDAMLFNSVL